MLTPSQSASAALLVKGSRFLAECLPLPSSSSTEARLLLKSQKQKHSSATHVAHAFLAGSSAQISGMSDDGEPSGTAGRPILDVLKGSDCSNIMITVARWFGGTLLGTGGLVKAYGGAAKLAFSKTPLEQLITKIRFTLQADYSQYRIIKKIAGEFKLYEPEETFSTAVTLTALIAETDLKDLTRKINDATSGKVQPLTE